MILLDSGIVQKVHDDFYFRKEPKAYAYYEPKASVFILSFFVFICLSVFWISTFRGRPRFSIPDYFYSIHRLSTRIDVVGCLHIFSCITSLNELAGLDKTPHATCHSRRSSTSARSTRACSNRSTILIIVQRSSGNASDWRKSEFGGTDRGLVGRMFRKAEFGLVGQIHSSSAVDKSLMPTALAVDLSLDWSRLIFEINILIVMKRGRRKFRSDVGGFRFRK